MVAGGVGGGIVGRLLNRKMDDRLVERLFLCLLIGIVGICVYNILRNLA